MRLEAVRARTRPNLFFFAAAVHAAVAVPLWIVTYGAISETGLTASWHGGEMIFGYAYAVFGGFLLTGAPRFLHLSLLAVWLAARIVALAPDAPGPVDAILAGIYPLLLFGYAVRPFVRAVKRWRNAVFVPVLAALFLAALLHGLETMDLVAPGTGSLLAFDLIVLMLFTMGGRVTAAAVSGAVQRSGGKLHAPAHPELEQAGLLCLVAAAASDLVAPRGPVTAGFAGLAMLLVLVRLVRWRAWRAPADPAVAFLLLGYLWLALGLGIRAFAGATSMIAPTEADHVLAVGALGTLSMTIMARIARQRLGRPLEFGRPVVTALGLVSFATVLRFLAALSTHRDELLIAAGACWSVAFIAFAYDLILAWRTACAAQPRPRRSG